MFSNEPQADLPIGPIAATSIVPVRFGDYYLDAFSTEFDLGALCVDITATRADDQRQHYVVTCEYRQENRTPESKGFDKATGVPHSSGQDATNFPQNPLDRAPVFTFGTEDMMVNYNNQDVTGKPYCNSHGDPFIPAMMRPISIATLDIQICKSPLVFDPTILAAYVNTTNAANFYGLIAGQVLCKGATASSKNENGVEYWDVTWHLKIAHNGPPMYSSWNQSVLDCGYSYYVTVGSDTLTKRAIDDNGAPVSQPILLQGSGFKKLPTDPPVYLSFQDYVSVSFAGIP